jgi:ABC-type multidrug transport system ATPase subunit/pSer/pThr/pTyr-binding forkhead associated (FHA) protein
MDVENSPSVLCSIKFISGPLNGKTFQIQKPVTQIGRDASNDIVVFDPKVSRHHVRIVWNNGSWNIENLSQKNTVTVNKNTVQQAILQQNSTIGLGDDTAFVFLVHSPVQPPSNGGVPASPPNAGGYGLQPGSSPNHGYPGPPVPVSYVPPPAGSPYPIPPQPSQPMPPQSSQPMAQVMADNAGDRSDRTMIEGIPSLEISSNLHPERTKHHMLKQVINVGRAPSSDIVINEPVVSGMHAQIVRENAQWILIHPHPTRGNTLNGLIYQGRTIRGDETFRKPLVHGDVFRIGDEHGTLVTLTYDDGSGASREIPPEVHPIPLGPPYITIGRLPDNMVVLNHPLVSGHHARLEQIPGGYRIVDLGSTNHVYVNGTRISHQAQTLTVGDEIRIGPYRLTYTGTQLTQYDESNSIRIDALDLKKKGNNNVVLLNGISLAIPPRKFVALVGGSGAGKSTLMDALNGLRPAQEGVVLYNGQDYYRNLAAFSTQLGYVPQDDIVHRELTVERALYYAARMRLPSDFTNKQIKQRINEVLEDVEMTERRGLLVNKLSGGQRKRVSIALELLANPSVFFLDEPTSGLDPGLDRKMMSLLRRLADRGRTIVLVTHATNNINVCDYVCFLAQGGRVAYFGPPVEAMNFFNKTDFAEIYSSLEPTKENPRVAQDAEMRFKASPDYYKYVVQPLNEGHAQRASIQQVKTIQRVKRGNPWKQFVLLSMRYIELLKNDVGNLAILLLQAPVVALLLVGMVRYEIGTGIFDADKVVFCRTQIFTKSGPIALPEAQKNETIKCDKVKTFLDDNKNKEPQKAPPQQTGQQSGQTPPQQTPPQPPQGSVKDFVKEKGSVDKALQEFIVPGQGSDAQKVLFIMAFATVLFGSLNGSREIVKEAAIYRRERAVNLGIIPYLFSKILVLFVLCLFQSAVLLFIVHAVEPLQKGVFLPVLLEAYITLVLTSLGGLLMGLTISAVVPNNDRAISLVPIILIPQVICSGAIIAIQHWPLQIVAASFPTRWAMVALGSTVGLHADKLGNDKLFGDDFSYHGTLFSIYSQNDAMQRILISWAALGAILILLTIMTGIFLKMKDVRS